MKPSSYGKPVILWLITVFMLSVYPTGGGSKIPYADKAVHFFLYAITCALFYSAIKGKRPFKTAVMISVLLSAGYGLLMELLQGLTARRAFSLSDEAANILGALSAAAVIVIRRRRGD